VAHLSSVRFFAELSRVLGNLGDVGDSGDIRHRRARGYRQSCREFKGLECSETLKTSETSEEREDASRVAGRGAMSSHSLIIGIDDACLRVNDMFKKLEKRVVLCRRCQSFSPTMPLSSRVGPLALARRTRVHTDPQPAHLRIIPFSEPRGRFTRQGGRTGTSAMLTRRLPPYTLDLVVFTFKVVWEGRLQVWFLFFDDTR